MKSQLSSLLFYGGVLFIIIFNAFLIPYLYFSAFSIATSQPIPTEVLSLSDFRRVHQQSTLINNNSTCVASTNQCCIYLGPIIGKTTTTQSRFMLELTQDIDLTFTLTKVSTGLNDNTPQSEQITTSILANTPTIVELDGLAPDSRYTIEFNNCHYPLTFQQPEGGHGLIKTLPTEWSETNRPRFAVISCNSINIRNREQRLIDQHYKPQGFDIQDNIVYNNQNTKNGNNDKNKHAKHKQDDNSNNINEILKALDNPEIVNYLSQSTELWSGLMVETAKLHQLLHLGDQAYMDSKHDNGIVNNQFDQSRTLVLDYLNNLWQYKTKMEHGDTIGAQKMVDDGILPPDIPTWDIIQQSYFTQPFSNIDDAFTKYPQQQHKINNIIPLSIKYQIYALYKMQYIKTFTHTPTRMTLSRVSNLMIWDDHDTFDDSGDCAADTDVLSLRNMIFKIGLAAYEHYQNALNKDNINSSEPTNPIPIEDIGTYYVANNNNNTFTTPRLSVKVQSFSLYYDKKILQAPVHRPMLTSPNHDSPADLTAQYAAITEGLHHFHVFTGGLCFIFLDTRSGRSPAAFNPQMYELYQQDLPTSRTHPYMLFGKKQWLDLETFLYDKAMQRCTALIVANSMPYVFMQSSPNYLVALFHDDMLGHFSSLEFEKEQVRLFNLFTNWREEQQFNAEQQQQQQLLVQNNTTNNENNKNNNNNNNNNNKINNKKAQLLLLGGDVHSSGYSQIYPYLYTNHTLQNAYMYNNYKINKNNQNTNTTTTKSTQITSKIEPISTLTVSPIQNEGLHIAWMTALTGFQYSYPIINNNNDISFLEHNGVFHTISSIYFKTMMYIEYYVGLVLPDFISTGVSRVMLIINKIITTTFRKLFMTIQYLTQVFTTDKEKYIATHGGISTTTHIGDMITELITGENVNNNNEHENNGVVDTTANNNNIQNVEQQQKFTKDKYYFGYLHHSWINTNAYAVVEVLFPSSTSNNNTNDGDNQSQQVRIQSQIVTKTRELTQDDIFGLYHMYKNQKATGGSNNNNKDTIVSEDNIYTPTLFSRFPIVTTTSEGY